MQTLHRSRRIDGFAAREAAAKAAAEDRTVDLVFTTGARVARFDWWSGTRYLEELSVDPKHVRMERLDRGAPLLATHNMFSLDAVIGVTESARIADGQGLATVRFAKTDEGEKALGLVRDGILRNVSVGYIVHRWEKTEAPIDGGLPIWRAIDWEPAEISLVSVPADPGAQIRGALVETATDDFQLRKDNAMPHYLDSRRAPDVSSPERQALADRDEVEIMRLGALTEGPERRAEILDRGMRSGLSATFIDRLVASDMTLEAACARMVDEVAAVKRTAAPLNPTRAEVLDNSVDARAAALRDMSEVLIARNDGKSVSERARRYGNSRIVDMQRVLLELGGVNTARMSRDEILARAITTGDLPNLLTSTGDRRLRAAYELAPSMKRIARKRTATDFRTINALQFSETPTFKKVLEGGEFKEGALSEGRESYALETAGAIVGVTRQALINDDLSAFLRVTKEMGVQAAEYENKTIVAILTANAAMGDGTVLFHANHGNQSAAPAVISDTTLGAAKLAMRLQKGLDGVTPINAAPKYLIVPAAIEVAAQKYLTTITPAQASNVNPFAGTLELIPEARLDADSATKWYCAADPDQVEGIEYCYLSDAEGPQLAMSEEFTTAGMKWRGLLDFAAKAIDWRGLYRNS